MSKQRVFVNSLPQYFQRVPDEARKWLYKRVENGSIESGWQLKREFNRCVTGYSVDQNTAALVFRDIKRHIRGGNIVRKKEWKQFFFFSSAAVIVCAIVGLIIYTHDYLN